MNFMKYPLEEILKVRRGCSENCLISKWRPKKLLSSTPENSVVRKSWQDIPDVETYDSVRMLRIDSSIEPIKVKTPLSDDQPIDSGHGYWKNVLHYHWPIIVHIICLAVIILIVGPWIGLGYNEEDTSVSSNNDGYILWSPLNALLSYSASRSSRKMGRGACSYRLYCTNKNTDTEPIRRKASFLRRKRNLKDFID